MDLRELKTKIENKTLDDSFLILTYEDNSFIADQYINAISEFKNKNKLLVNNLKDLEIKESFDIFDLNSQDDNLYILNLDKLEEFTLSPENLNNRIIKCKNIDSNLKKNLSEYIVSIPKLQNWQIEAYISSKVPGLAKDKVSWLCEICKNDIYRLDVESDKLKIFAPGSQELIFRNISDENGYCDLNPLTIFNFTNAILKKDIKTVHEILKDIENIDIEGTGAVTLLSRNFKNIINIQLNSKATPESLGMNYKQFNAIRYNCGKYSAESLVRIYELLTSVDMRLKSGELPNQIIREYLITKILSE